MKLLGAKVHPVDAGSRSLKDALNEALRDWITNVRNTYYLIGTAAGPHPYPMIVRDFQAVIGREARRQIIKHEGRLPDALVACVNGGSNAIGLFYPFIKDSAVRMVGVEAAGLGLNGPSHAATLTAGSVGVLHGNRTYLLQDEMGQIRETHSIAAGLDYPGVGPEHAWLKDTGRASYVTATDAEALDALKVLSRNRGNHPGAGKRPCGRAHDQAGAHDGAGLDRDRQSVGPRRQGHAKRRDGAGRQPVDIEEVGRWRRQGRRIARKFEELRARGEAALVPFIVAGDPDLKHTGMLVMEMEARGADLIELGIPFSDPMADGPANQRALARGLAGGGSLSGVLGLVGELRKQTQIPIILFGYFNPFFRYGCERLCADAAQAGVDGLLVVDMPPEESRELAHPARAAGIDLIYLLAPTTPLARSRTIARSASGFLYYVSVTGVTGARAQVGADVERHVRELTTITRLPIGVGFGISTPGAGRASRRLCRRSRGRQRAVTADRSTWQAPMNCCRPSAGWWDR